MIFIKAAASSPFLKTRLWPIGMFMLVGGDYGHSCRVG